MQVTLLTTTSNLINYKNKSNSKELLVLTHIVEEFTITIDGGCFVSAGSKLASSCRQSLYLSIQKRLFFGSGTSACCAFREGRKFPNTINVLSVHQGLAVQRMAAMSSDHSAMGDDKCPCSVTVITWNIDGLDESLIPERTVAVCDTIQSENADVVLLQEVVAQSLEILLARLGEHYEVFAPDTHCPYYAALLVSKVTFEVPAGCFSCYDYPGTTQGRQLLMAKGVKHRQTKDSITVLTSHLESLRDYSAERKRQLRHVYTVMNDQRATGSSVVFGGDTNLRANEVKAVPMPANIYNAWEYCGSPEESKYTWDLALNDNKVQQWPGPPTRTQYDKLFVSREGGLMPNSFRLLGTTRLACRRFPSDHFGIICRLCRQGNHPAVQK